MFLKSNINDVHIQKIIDDYCLYKKIDKNFFIDIILKEYNEIVSKRKSFIFKEMNDNLIEELIYKYIFEDKDFYENVMKKEIKFDKNILFKLFMMMKAENRLFMPIKNVYFKKNAIPRIILVPSNLTKYTEKDVPTSACSPECDILMNVDFINKMLYMSKVRGDKPKSKKYVSNGGEIPDEYAIIEFLIAHELFHYVYGDHFYSDIFAKKFCNEKNIKVKNDELYRSIFENLVNITSDFIINYNLIKHYKLPQLPIGLYNSKINYDNYESYYSMIKDVFDNMMKEKIEEMIKENQQQNQGQSQGQQNQSQQGQNQQNDQNQQNQSQNSNEDQNQQKQQNQSQNNNKEENKQNQQGNEHGQVQNQKNNLEKETRSQKSGVGNGLEDISEEELEKILEKISKDLNELANKTQDKHVTDNNRINREIIDSIVNSQTLSNEIENEMKKINNEIKSEAKKRDKDEITIDKIKDLNSKNDTLELNSKNSISQNSNNSKDTTNIYGIFTPDNVKYDVAYNFQQILKMFMISKSQKNVETTYQKINTRRTISSAPIAAATGTLVVKPGEIENFTEKKNLILCIDNSGSFDNSIKKFSVETTKLLKKYHDEFGEILIIKFSNTFDVFRIIDKKTLECEKVPNHFLHIDTFMKEVYGKKKTAFQQLPFVQVMFSTVGGETNFTKMMTNIIHDLYEKLNFNVLIMSDDDVISIDNNLKYLKFLTDKLKRTKSIYFITNSINNAKLYIKNLGYKYVSYID